MVHAFMHKGLRGKSISMIKTGCRTTAGLVGGAGGYKLCSLQLWLNILII